MKETAKPARLRKMETKETVTFRLTKGLKQRMDLATIVKSLNLSEYAELAIENQLKKDRIPEGKAE
jgi:hypothetical protein